MAERIRDKLKGTGRDLNYKEVVSILKRKNIINPLARESLDMIKYEIAEELGYFDSKGAANPEMEYRKALEKMKFEVAGELGISLQQGYNGDLTSRETGRIGGRLGGKIGGNMVRRMIKYAEERMAEESQNRY